MEPDLQEKPTFFLTTRNPRYQPSWKAGVAIGLLSLLLWTVLLIESAAPLMVLLLVPIGAAIFFGLAGWLLWGFQQMMWDIFTGKYRADED